MTTEPSKEAVHLDTEEMTRQGLDPGVAKDRQEWVDRRLIIPGIGSVGLYGEATITDEVTGHSEVIEGQGDDGSTKVTRHEDGSISVVQKIDTVDQGETIVGISI